MSSRKPRPITIHDDLSDDDKNRNDGENFTIKPIKTIKPKKKLQIPTSFIDNSSEDESLPDVNFKLKRKKQQKRKNGTLFIPFLNQDDDNEPMTPESKKPDSYINKNLRDQFDSQKQSQSESINSTVKPSELEIISIVDDEDDEEMKSEQLKSTKREQEYISLESPPAGKNSNKSDQEDEDLDMDANVDILHDGVLPLSEKEANLQKKLHDMGIEDALYEVELSANEELDDWEESKLKHGTLPGTSSEDAILKSGNKKLKLPTLQLIDSNRTLDQEIQSLKSKWDDLVVQRTGIKETLNQLSINDDDLTAKIKEITNAINAVV